MSPIVAMSGSVDIIPHTFVGEARVPHDLVDLRQLPLRQKR